MAQIPETSESLIVRVKDSANGEDVLRPRGCPLFAGFIPVGSHNWQLHSEQKGKARFRPA